MTRQRQPLTRRQREFFDYLRGRMEAGQDAPSLRTAAEELGVSHTAVAGLLQTLLLALKNDEQKKEVFLRIC